MVYVDPVFTWTEFAGHTRWCHMGTDDRTPAGLEAFHAFAERIGLKKSWFQEKDGHPHYDLTEAKRRAAVRAGAVPVDHKEYIIKCTDHKYQWMVEEDEPPAKLHQMDLF